MRTGFFITARLKSTRLPRKALLPLNGRPLISHLLDRAREMPVDTIVLCTSTCPQDDPLVSWAALEEIPCFRGDPEDVLGRLTAAAELHGVDSVVSATADNPLTDPLCGQRLLEFHLGGGFDYCALDGLPLGTAVYTVQREALRRACALKASKDTEIWGPYFTQTGQFQCGRLEISEKWLNWPDLRLTVDTPEDFALMERIFASLYTGRLVTLAEAVAFCRNHQELLGNSHILQRQSPLRSCFPDLTSVQLSP